MPLSETQQLAKEQLVKNPVVHTAFHLLKMSNLHKEQEGEFDNAPIGDWLEALIKPSEDTQDTEKIVQQTADRMFDNLNGIVAAVQL